MSCRGSATTTHYPGGEVHIRVAPVFLPSESTDTVNYFAYQITITNRGSSAVRLLSRLWRITDGDNKTREVQGDGVVGEQPLIAGGASYQYTSFVDFHTAVGYMEGAYTMETADGQKFQAEIAMFSLSLPGVLH